MAPPASSPSSISSSSSASSASSPSSSSPKRKRRQSGGLVLVALSLLSCFPVPARGKLPHFPDESVVDENNLTEGDPHSLDYQEILSLLQHLQQENDLKKTDDGLQPEARSDQVDPRFIGITDGGLYRGDLVVYLPITILLPTLAFRSRYSLAGRKSFDWSSFLFGRNQARSLDSEDIRGRVDQVLTNQVRYDPNLFEYKTDPNFGPLLSRIDAYFHYLRVHDDECRMRAICQLAQNPQKYSPLSYLVLSALKKSESLKRPTLYNAVVFRFLRYYWAAERGVSNYRCDHAYRQCPAGLEDIVDMRVLTFWQNLASLVSIKLSDE
ncbi:uncharacterized protein LOC135224680 [Macrobrachium nipponense]|uniref:uncharacterized protein LOC135224680 n=1 Tax=Macrobrachium nipponense TaxID=159736 RepID=UPI0030C8B71C